jgi:hypothetical protein
MEIALAVTAVIAGLLVYGVYLFEKWLDDNERFF